MSEPSNIVTLMTDFGDTDAYVGVVKGVILAKTPAARIVDLTHRLPPQDVYAAAYVLETAWPWFPPGTVHVAIVDPGVGTDRAILGVRTAGGSVVLAPDNGLLTPLYDLETVTEAARVLQVPGAPESASATFQGRDVFAPAAAHLARGKALRDLGPVPGVPMRLPEYRPIPDGDGFRARILHIDRFGNAITTARQADLGAPAAFEVVAGEHELGTPLSTYAEVAPGKPLALIGSSDHLEIAIRNGSAARTLGLRRGDMVRIVPRGGS